MPAGLMAIVGRSGSVSTGNADQNDAPLNVVQAELMGFDGRIMGTGYSIRIAPNNSPSLPQVNNKQFGKAQLAELASNVADRLRNIDSLMSTWKYDSELSHLNRSVSRDWQPLSSSTVRVLAHALKTSQRSLGAFDPTVSPLVDLWGFGAQQGKRLSESFSKPTSQHIQKTLAHVGYASVELNVEQNRVRKLNPNTQIDLSGIAKGFAVDQVAKLLDDVGLSNYIIEIGGELRAKGEKSLNTPWKVAIEKPFSDQRDALRGLVLNNSAVATSGDYRNFFVHNGQRYSHVIDPRFGVPVKHDLVSVTVVSDTTMEADALSTALMIMGPGQALSFAQNHGVAAHFMYNTSHGVVEHHSAAFERHLV